MNNSNNKSMASSTPKPLPRPQKVVRVLALRQEYVQARPGPCIFDFLERHWPKLVNSIGNDIIPATNNTVELVIRRFDQHYQTFCGFELLQAAYAYLAVFEKVYRLTPFSQDAQPRLRGKCPCNWPAMMSASCPWPPSAPASASSGRCKPARSLMSPVS